MARGFESKQVEEQQAESQRRQGGGRPNLSPEEQVRGREKANMLLLRTKVSNDLKNSQNEAHKKMLESALADIETRLSSLG